jgi:hypothetical protein
VARVDTSQERARIDARLDRLHAQLRFADWVLLAIAAAVLASVLIARRPVPWWQAVVMLAVIMALAAGQLFSLAANRALRDGLRYIEEINRP